MTFCSANSAQWPKEGQAQSEKSTLSDKQSKKSYFRTL